jgi:hypothetical protein
LMKGLPGSRSSEPEFVCWAGRVGEPPAAVAFAGRQCPGASFADRSTFRRRRPFEMDTGHPSRVGEARGRGVFGIVSRHSKATVSSGRLGADEQSAHRLERSSDAGSGRRSVQCFHSTTRRSDRRTSTLVCSGAIVAGERPGACVDRRRGGDALRRPGTSACAL